MTFLEFLAQNLGATITTADKTADGTADICVNGNVITQSQFSTNFTAWLKGGDVFGSDDFKTFVANQLHANANLTQQFITDTLAMLDAGTYTVELNQNSAGAPYIVELAGLIDFNDLFSDGISTDVKTGGKVTQDRWYVNEYQTHEAAHYLTFDFHTGLTVVADNTSDYVDNTQDVHFNGADGVDGTDGTNASAAASTSGTSASDQVVTAGDGTGGTNGTSGEDAYNITNTTPYDGIKFISEGASPNSILGGTGGDGGDGGVGGDATATASESVSSDILTAGDGGNGGNGGSGGHAIINGDLSTVIIEGSQDLTILGGTNGNGGAGGDGGDATVTSGKNANGDTLTAGDGGDGGDGSTAGDAGDGGDATLTATGQQKNDTLNDGSDGGAGASSGIIAAFSDRVDVDASAFTGHLTISGSDYNDTMVFGSGGTTVFATTGDDAYTFNGAADEIVIYTAANQSDGTSKDTINGFDINNDQIDISAITQAVAVWSSSWDDTTDVLSIDLNDDSTDDMVINLVGVNAANVDAILIA